MIDDMGVAEDRCRKSRDLNVDELQLPCSEKEYGSECIVIHGSSLEWESTPIMKPSGCVSVHGKDGEHLEQGIYNPQVV
jgi:hypothetical protein